MSSEIVEREYVRECPGGGCDTRFIGMTPDEYREKHAQEGVCAGGPLARLFAFPTKEYREQEIEE